MHWNWNDGWSGWNWALMTIGMVAFWGFVIWGIMAFGRSDPPRDESDSAEQILGKRLATGEIDGKEYQQRLDVLRSVNVPADK